LIIGGLYLLGQHTQPLSSKKVSCYFRWTDLRQIAGKFLKSCLLRSRFTNIVELTKSSAKLMRRVSEEFATLFQKFCIYCCITYMVTQFDFATSGDKTNIRKEREEKPDHDTRQKYRILNSG